MNLKTSFFIVSIIKSRFFVFRSQEGIVGVGGVGVLYLNKLLILHKFRTEKNRDKNVKITI